MSGRFDDRVQDLLTEAGACADAGDWDGVRDLARAALALAPASQAARDLLDRADAARPADGERRQLTVMFCDVVGSTTLSHDHDPELVREVLRSYQATCDEAVRRYDGRIARFIGDGILAYFGHPVAHEDDARRAVKAGLDLLSALRPVTEEIAHRYGIELAVRVAVHTGVVVLADMGSAANPDRDAIVGETPNVAARLQDHARPGTIAISQATYELVRGWFLVAPLGPLALKGISDPVTAYQVVEETATESRVQAQADLSPFVGRTALLDELYDAWDQVRAGGSKAVVLRGQPGVGKSRLADLLRRRAQLDEGGTLIANCSAYHGSTALFPVRRLLEQAAGIDVHHHADRALPRLWTVMEAAGQVESVPLFADLLELPPTTWAPAPELDGDRRHDALLAALVSFVAASAARSPLLLVVDDVQWADPSTIELLGRIVAARVPGLLTILTAREELVVPWPGAQVIEVDRLSADELQELARRLPESRHLGRADVERAIERSDGIPFFLEELLRSSVVAQATVAEPTSPNIPAVLRDLLLARFAAPGVDLQLAQRVATIGDQASASLVAALLGCPLPQLDGMLAPMVAAGILVRGDGEPTTYHFRHQLLAELAYDTQLREARERSHSAVANALRSGATVGVASAPAVVARHLERAGRTDEAIEALIDASEAANALGARDEMTELLNRGLELVPQASAVRRPDLEFELRLLRGTSVSSLLGYAAPQAVMDFEACLHLAESVVIDGYVDDLPDDVARHAYDLVSSTTALWANQLLQGRIDEAEALNKTTVARFRPGGQPRAFAEAGGDSFTWFFRGDYDRAGSMLEDLTRMAREFTMPGRSSMPNDPTASGYAHLGFVRAVQGRFDESRAVFEEGQAMAEGIGFPLGPFTSCYVLGMRASSELVMGDPAAADEAAAAQAELAERHGYTFWTLVSGLYRATVDYANGDDGAGERAVMTITMLRALGVLVWLPSFLAVLADARLDRGDVEGAAALLADAAEIAEQTGAHYWTTDILRLRGEVAVAQGQPGGLDLLREAVALAQEQGAALLELRARTSLYRHSRDPEDREPLAQLLKALPLSDGAPNRVDAEALLAAG